MESGESADNAIATDQLISYTSNAAELLMQIGTIILVGSIGMNDTVVIFFDQIIIRPDKTFGEKILEKLIEIKHKSQSKELWWESCPYTIDALSGAQFHSTSWSLVINSSR